MRARHSENVPAAEPIYKKNAAYRPEAALRDAIVKKARVLVGYGGVALLVYPVPVLGLGWARWIEALLIVTLVLRELGMIRALEQFYSGFRSQTAVRNHTSLAVIALFALTYALFGLLARWPVPWVPLLAASVITLAQAQSFASAPGNSTGGDTE
jgi:hypothetical protein